MVKSITVTNYLGVTETLVLAEQEPSHGIIVKEVKGLGPTKADISTMSLATTDGSLFNSARLGERNIVLNLLFDYAPTIETTRQRTYQLFPIKKQVTLIIETDNRTLQVSGYVESNDPDIFTALEGCQISILCPDPYMYTAGENGIKTVVFYGIEPEFEFEFSNESDTVKLLKMGNIEDKSEKDLFYEGDSEVGVTITIHSSGEVGDITIYNTGTREAMKLDSNKIKRITGYEESEYGIIAGDDIIINTIRGQKSILLLRDGEYTNIINAMDRGSDWFQLAKGDNIFAFIASYGQENLLFKIEYRLLYDGI